MVTGASSGIGAAVARALAHEGAHVALAARRHDTLAEVQAGLKRPGGEVRTLVVPTDVTDHRQVKALVARTEEELGPVDILVNCAGMMYYTLVGCGSQHTQRLSLRFRALLSDGAYQVRFERVAADRILES